MGYPHKPHARETVLLSKYFGDPEARTYKGWVKRGGYEAWRQAQTMTPAAITDLVKESGLRGRGGAGFPTGLKWSCMPKEKKKPHYLCVNADESEPGTAKDREIMRWTPHALLEGAASAAHAIQAEVVYIYIRGECTEPWAVMQKPLAQAAAAGRSRPTTRSRWASRSKTCSTTCAEGCPRAGRSRRVSPGARRCRS